MSQYRHPPESRVCNLIAIAAFVLGVLGGASGLAAATASAQTTVVSLTFDHGLLNQYTAVRPLLKQHGLRATFFVNSGHIGTDKYYYMSWGQLQALYADGNEVGGHTLTHANPTGLTPDQQRTEVCDDRTNLLRQGFSATDFAYPYGVDSIARGIVQGCGYNSARTTGTLRWAGCDSCPYAERIPPVGAYATRASVEMNSGVSLDTLESYVTGAESHGGGWVQLEFTHVCDGCSPYAISPAKMDAFLAWLNTRRATGTVVKTVNQVIGGVVQPPPLGTPNILLPGAKDTISPIILSLSLARRSFAVGRATTPVIARRRKGTAFLYTVSEPGRVRFKIQRRSRTRRSSCRRRHARTVSRRRCVRYRSVGAIVRSVTTLSNRTRFSGRIGRKALRAGRYRAVLTETDAAGNRSRPRRVGFRVVRG
jgi:peptidoglycan/xylan/chitin deacetylase (PgdA/CDA1 family)